MARIIIINNDYIDGETGNGLPELVRIGGLPAYFQTPEDAQAHCEAEGIVDYVLEDLDEIIEESEEGDA